MSWSVRDGIQTSFDPTTRDAIQRLLRNDAMLRGKQLGGGERVVTPSFGSSIVQSPFIGGMQSPYIAGMGATPPLQTTPPPRSGSPPQTQHTAMSEDSTRSFLVLPSPQPRPQSHLARGAMKEPVKGDATTPTAGEARYMHSMSPTNIAFAKHVSHNVDLESPRGLVVSVKERLGSSPSPRYSHTPYHRTPSKSPPAQDSSCNHQLPPAQQNRYSRQLGRVRIGAPSMQMSPGLSPILSITSPQIPQISPSASPRQPVSLHHQEDQRVLASLQSRTLALPHTQTQLHPQTHPQTHTHTHPQTQTQTHATEPDQLTTLADEFRRISLLSRHMSVWMLASAFALLRRTPAVAQGESMKLNVSVTQPLPQSMFTDGDRVVYVMDRVAE